MNTGANFLREHIIQEARLHYAMTNTGGISPNVVQAEAEVLYLIRAPGDRSGAEHLSSGDQYRQGRGADDRHDLDPAL